MAPSSLRQPFRLFLLPQIPAPVLILFYIFKRERERELSVACASLLYADRFSLSGEKILAAFSRTLRDFWISVFARGKVKVGSRMHIMLTFRQLFKFAVAKSNDWFMFAQPKCLKITDARRTFINVAKQISAVFGLDKRRRRGLLATNVWTFARKIR